MFTLNLGRFTFSEIIPMWDMVCDFILMADYDKRAVHIIMKFRGQTSKSKYWMYSAVLKYYHCMIIWYITAPCSDMIKYGTNSSW